MRKLLYVAAIAAGVVLALGGEEPHWPVALAALLIFPVAAGLALRKDSGRTSPLGLALPAGSAGGALTALALRVAAEAPDWVSATSADCGGAGTGTQQLVAWAAAVIFVLSALPVAASLVALGHRLGRRAGDPPGRLQAPLSAFPIAVAASGLALVVAGYVTAC